MRYTGKDSGNKLERDLLAKLLDKDEVAQLRIDGMMYYHVYADLVMLSKSNDLQKSAYDMNLHYLELKTYLSKVEHNPEVVMDAGYHVFQSEMRLYGDNSVTNHRLRPVSQTIYRKLFEPSEIDCDVLCPLLAAGTVKMRAKLCTYMLKDHLPGGRYWHPETELRKVLTELKPSNDLQLQIYIKWHVLI